MFVLQIQRRLSWFNFTCLCTRCLLDRRKKKEIEVDEEPPCSVLWIKGRENKDGEYLDAEIGAKSGFQVKGGDFYFLFILFIFLDHSSKKYSETL